MIDADLGHDDSIAIMTLLTAQEEIEILGFVSVAGNQTVDNVTLNMLKIVELTKCDIPIAKGESKPLFRDLET